MSSQKSGAFDYLQRVGKSLILPISLLPLAGLFLGLGSSFTNETTIATYGLEWLLADGTVLNGLLQIMNVVGNVILGNLALLFAMSIAYGMAKTEQPVAVISAVVGYLVMNATMGGMLTLTGQVLADGTVADFVTDGAVAEVLGITTLQTGVFSGIITGLGVAALHNRFYKQKLPDALSFFSGVRFVPIVTTFVYLVVGLVMFAVWPTVQQGIFMLGDFIRVSGYAGTFAYGALERVLIPFGLHQVLNMAVWQTAVGGTAVIDGVQYFGAINIFFAELASPNTQQFSTLATHFITGKFAVEIAGLPMACLAMYHCAAREKRKAVGAMLFSAALTSLIFGVTEPIEFTFLFIAPMLYAAHAVLMGMALVVCEFLKICVGQTFSCGIIDFILYGILPGQEKSNWLMMIPVFIAYGLIYYWLFRIVITKLNLPTPGREGSEDKLYTKKDYLEQKGSTEEQAPTELGDVEMSAEITAGLGGVDNILEVGNCASRLRVTLKDISRIDEARLKATGAFGVFKKDNGAQVVYGPKVYVITSELQDYLRSLGSNITTFEVDE